MLKLSCPECGHHIGNVDPRLIAADGTGRSSVPLDIADTADDVQLFIDDLCDGTNPRSRTTSADLYAAYESWASARNDDVPSARTFSLALRSIGYEPQRSSSARYFRGIQLRK